MSTNKLSNKKSTKERIFEAAVQLFSTKGFHGTSMRDLAKEVGIKESSIYNHFPGKNSILDAMLEYQMTGFQRVIEELNRLEKDSPELTDPLDIWLAGADVFIKILPPLTYKVNLLIINEMFLNEKCRKFVLQSMFATQTKLMEQTLKGLHDKGYIRDCDIHMTSVQYVYMLHGLENENRLLLLEGHNPKDLHKKMLKHITFFIKGLRKS
ncbi:MAG: TetR/AcrR family transcriptional regulator [bacterium]|nr:TetR/AcrR family transcriptional regulator [bacterium]